MGGAGAHGHPGRTYPRASSSGSDAAGPDPTSTDSVRADRYVAMQIEDPVIDHLDLATSMGVAGTRVDHADDIGDVVKAALASGAPHLVEIPIARTALKIDTTAR